MIKKIKVFFSKCICLNSFFLSSMVVLFLFFLIRIYYWFSIYEEPFSDLFDYFRLGQQVAHYLDFRTSDFWISYKPPGVPLFFGFVFSIFGFDNLFYLRMAQTVVYGLAFIWLGYEFRKKNLSLLYIVVYWLVVILSKSSIFWSYKSGTESLSEAFILLNTAIGLYAFRKRTSISFLLLGATLMYGTLIRPQAFFVLPAFILYFLIFVREWDFFSRMKAISLVCFAAFIIWFPWGTRNFIYYGHPLLFSTQGPYSFLWDLGPVTILSPLDKVTPITKNVNELQMEAPKQFKNDYEAMTYAHLFVQKWLQEKKFKYIQIIFQRIINTMVDNSIDLTKVSSDDLFQGFPNNILLRKSWFLVLFGVIGYFVGSFFYFRDLLWVLTVPVSQWLMGSLFLGYPRILEPSLTLILFGNIFWMSRLYVFLKKFFHRLILIEFE